MKNHILRRTRGKRNAVSNYQTNGTYRRYSEQRKNPDGTIQIFYRKSDGVLYAVNGSAAKLQDGEAIVICSESAQIAAADITAEAFAHLKRISA